MNCKICGKSQIKLIYSGKIRNGGIGSYTVADVPVYQCESCKVIWHQAAQIDHTAYYESTEYRDSLEGSSGIDEFYQLHDRESFAKLTYSQGKQFRKKVTADIGCGGGAFLDCLKGISKELIAIEPSREYRTALQEKGYHTYAYAVEAVKQWGEKTDIVTSFDVIEHVESPQQFLQDVFNLLQKGGQAIIGTPTDAPVMRQLLGGMYEKKLLFSTQHLWIFSEKNLKILAQNTGFEKIEIKYFQRYGLNNFVGWMQQQKPCGEPDYPFITDTMNTVWKQELCSKGLSDYIVLYLEK